MTRELPRRKVDPREFPSISQQARNLMKTAGQVAKNPRLADEKMFNERMNICKACDLYNAQQNRCTKCGCHLKGKARFKAASCPIGKW